MSEKTQGQLLREQLCWNIPNIAKAIIVRYKTGLVLIVDGLKLYIRFLKKFSLPEVCAGVSLTKKMLTKPTIKTTAPIKIKMVVQLEESERSKDINPPNTTSIATSGIIELTPSTTPR